jgi:serine/threonine-protein kinase RsbW
VDAINGTTRFGPRHGGAILATSGDGEESNARIMPARHPPEREVVMVSVPAKARFVQVLRAATASVASHLRIPYDAVEDLRLAVDEASARLLAIRKGARTLSLELQPRPDRLEVVVQTDAIVSEWPAAGLEETLAWTVLAGLVDLVRPEIRRGGPSIRLVMRTLDPLR